MTSYDVKLFARSVETLSIVLGFHAENQQRAIRGQAMAYVADDFAGMADRLSFLIHGTMARNAELESSGCPGCVKAASRCAICEAVINDEAAAFSLGAKLNYLCDECAKAQGLCG